MDKEKRTRVFSELKEKLQFLKMDDLDQELDFDSDAEEIDEKELAVEEKQLSSGGTATIDLPEGNLKEKLERNRRRILRRRIALILLFVTVAGGFVLYNKLYTFRDYIIADSYENTVSGGTKYESAGKNIYRYNSDGVSCVTRKNELKWSITYNMQAPITDVSSDTMVIAEQQGNQIYVINKDGLVGSFETVLPILKVCVSNQGVVAAVLQEENTTWVNLYQADGTVVAENKTTVAESGYPLDIAISPDGQKLAVAYLGIQEGVMTGSVIFYHFGDAGKTVKNHIVGSESYADTVIPEVYFAGNSRAVAISDSGCMIFGGNNEIRQSAAVTVEDEIVSCFYDGERIGFLTACEEEGYTYRMNLYNYRGKRTCSRKINADFDDVKIENGQILMYSGNSLEVYTLSGQKRFESAYEKEIEDVFYFSEFRKYLVITPDSFDRIRIS